MWLPSQHHQREADGQVHLGQPLSGTLSLQQNSLQFISLLEGRGVKLGEGEGKNKGQGQPGGGRAEPPCQVVHAHLSWNPALGLPLV